MGVIGTRKAKKRILVKKAGHPGAFRKMRCQACKLGYAVESNHQGGTYQCSRCGQSFTVQKL